MLPTVEELSKFIGLLNSLGLKYAIGGSVASSLWSSPRTTNDVDITVALGPVDVERFIDAFGADYVISESEIVEAAKLQEKPSMFQVLDPETQFRVDVFVADKTDYTMSEMERIRDVELLPGLTVSVIAPENIVLRKLEWYQLGNRVSDRQWNDLVGVIEVQGPALDRGYMLKWAKELGVLDLAQEALAEAKEF